MRTPTRSIDDPGDLRTPSTVRTTLLEECERNAPATVLDSATAPTHSRISPRISYLITIPAPDKRIGGGGFCDLYLGLYAPPGRSSVKLAMKRPRLLGPDTSQAEEVIRKYEREARIWSSLDHKNVLPFWGLLDISSDVYLVSPWMEHGDLSRFLAIRLSYLEDLNDMQSLASEEMQVAFHMFDEANTIYGIASGLAYLHASGVIHGDLKAANILLGDYLTPMLCDFGMSKDEEFNETSTGMKGCGTSRWMSPELMDDSPKTDKTDIYAFGMTIVEILTGKVPFPQHNRFRVITAVTSGERPSFEPSSRNGKDFVPLWDVAAACWKEQPAERLTADEAVSYAETLALDGVALNQDSPSPPASAKSDFSRSTSPLFIPTELDLQESDEILAFDSEAINAMPYHASEERFVYRDRDLAKVVVQGHSPSEPSDVQMRRQLLFQDPFDIKSHRLDWEWSIKEVTNHGDLISPGLKLSTSSYCVHGRRRRRRNIPLRLRKNRGVLDEHQDSAINATRCRSICYSHGYHTTGSPIVRYEKTYATTDPWQSYNTFSSPALGSGPHACQNGHRPTYACREGKLDPMQAASATIPINSLGYRASAISHKGVSASTITHRLRTTETKLSSNIRKVKGQDLVRSLNPKDGTLRGMVPDLPGILSIHSEFLDTEWTMYSWDTPDNLFSYRECRRLEGRTRPPIPRPGTFSLPCISALAIS